MAKFCNLFPLILNTPNPNLYKTPHIRESLYLGAIFISRGLGWGYLLLGESFVGKSPSRIPWLDTSDAWGLSWGLGGLEVLEKAGATPWKQIFSMRLPFSVARVLYELPGFF